jgi:hypothetical protein
MIKIWKIDDVPNEFKIDPNNIYWDAATFVMFVPDDYQNISFSFFKYEFDDENYPEINLESGTLRFID